MTIRNVAFASNGNKICLSGSTRITKQNKCKQKYKKIK